jgi:MoaA/NifB/PqqE/SkfB family radical SAM enzyme
MSKNFDCQSAYEMKSHCNEQCDHCKEYYVERDPLTSYDVIRFNLLKWLKKKDILSDDIDIIWQEFIEENP